MFEERALEDLGFGLELLKQGQAERAQVLLRSLYVQVLEEQKARKQAYEEWVEAREAEARELSSYPGLLEEVPF